MNRYQIEVAEMDRKNVLKLRALSFSGAALLIVGALWSAGLPPTQWWTKFQVWFQSRQNETQVAGRPTGADVATQRVPGIGSSSHPPAHNHAALGTDASASTAPLRLILVEANPGRNSREGTARIGTSVENPQTYSAGALLANGAKLTEIHAEYVLLEQGARVARLNRNPSAADDKSGSILFVGGEKPADARKPTTADPLLKILRPSPVFEGNQVSGIEVYPAANGALFSQLGLQPGDVLVAINGVPITETKAALELLRELTNGVALTAFVLRKSGTSGVVSLDGTLIVADRDRSAMASTHDAMPPSF